MAGAVGVRGQDGPAPAEPLRPLHFLAGGEWISEETLRDGAGREFRSVRRCALEADEKVLLCRGPYQYDDGERSTVNLVGLYAWNSVRQEVVNWAGAVLARSRLGAVTVSPPIRAPGEKSQRAASSADATGQQGGPGAGGAVPVSPQARAA